MFAIDLQLRGFNSSEPEDGRFILRRFYEFSFLIVALTRLRRAAILAKKIPELQSHMSTALHDFDTDVPNLRSLRNVAEHIDDYAVYQGKDKSISRRQLEVASISNDPPTLEWLGHTLNAQEARDAGLKLLLAIRSGHNLIK